MPESKLLWSVKTLQQTKWSIGGESINESAHSRQNVGQSEHKVRYLPPADCVNNENALISARSPAFAVFRLTTLQTY